MTAPEVREAGLLPALLLEVVVVVVPLSLSFLGARTTDK